MSVVKVGCCGFPVAKSRYYEAFRVVEVQQTFYKPPSLDTLKSWRSEAPSDFEFTVKAWQVVTHPPSSPTWRKAGMTVSRELEDKYGYLRPTKENLEAWQVTVRCARELGARIIVVQTPPSFRCTEQNINNAKRFFSMVSSTDYVIAWEPRGDWLEKPSVIEEIIKSFNVIHVVDPLYSSPAIVKEVVYFRLHGRYEGGRIMYKHKYSDEELRILVRRVAEVLERGAKTVYVMFNNAYMYEDAKRFKELAKASGLEVL